MLLQHWYSEGAHKVIIALHISQLQYALLIIGFKEGLRNVVCILE